jgi:hypothetical protein
MKMTIEMLADDDLFDNNKQIHFFNILKQIQTRILSGDSYGVVYNDNDIKIAWFDVEFSND